MVLWTPIIIIHASIFITNYLGASTHHIVKTYPKVLLQIKYIYAKPSGNIPTHLFHPRDISESDVPEIIV